MKTKNISNDSIEAMIPLLIQVQRDIDQNLDLESMAARFGYSPFHFHRLFKKAVDETPRQYVGRLRLESAAYKLLITDESILDICISTGFKNHETFARNFRKRFGCSPSQYRAEGKIAQNERLERNRSFRGDRCVLSEVRFESLRRMHLLSVRTVGSYDDIPVPFSKEDRLWNDIVRWAATNKIAFNRLAVGIYHDNPTVTPGEAQRCDAGIPVDGAVAGTQRIRCIPFDGGLYGVIEHTGPGSTLIQGFRSLADGIRRSTHYEFRDGPAVEINRHASTEAECPLNRTDIYLPVKKIRK